MNNSSLVDATAALSQDYPKYVAALAIALIVVVVLLSIVIINQNNKLKEMQKPKYGFLGKPVYGVLLLVVFSIGGFGFIYFGTNNSLNVQETSANRQVELTIRAFPLSPGSNNYSITLIPNINKNPWGNDNSNKFDVYWTITTNTSVSTEVELARSLYNQGGIVKQLNKGVNKIKATVFFDNQNYEKEIQVIL